MNVTKCHGEINLRQIFLAGFAAIALGVAGQAAHAADQTVPGAGNALAATIAGNSALITSGLQRIRGVIEDIGDASLRHTVHDLLLNADVCIKHRANLTAAAKTAIVNQLLAEGLIGEHSGDGIQGGLVAGVFPPVADDGTACPHKPQPFFAAPGGGQHHAYPGGLVVHESFNTRSALSLAENYRVSYGFTAADGLPRIGPIGTAVDARKLRLTIKNDLIIAAPLLHDFGKVLVFQWNTDGSMFNEMGIAGTGGHHVIGLAESIKRRLPPELVITQASAHQPPNTDNEANVVNWLRAASIIAGVDPVSYGVLTLASDGNLHLPPVRRLGETDLIAGGQNNLLVEYTIDNLSDADWVYAEPAVGQSDILLKLLASRYGYSATADSARYVSLFRNAVLSNLGGEHIQIVYANEGLAGVAHDLDLLRAKGVF